MSQYVDTNTKGFVAAGVIKLYARVILGSGGTITEAVLAEREIGIAMTPGLAIGDIVTVKLRSANGTHKVIAAAAITRGASCFSAAAGRVSNTATGAFNVGIALEAAGALGDVIEMLYIPANLAVA